MYRALPWKEDKMAKTIKNSTAKKQPSGVSKALNWLKPTTPAKGMLLFVIVFAIAGGAYYAYKSSAASWTVYPKDFSYSGGAYMSTDTHSSKGTVTVAKLTPNSVITNQFLIASPWNASPGRTVQTRLCVDVRAPLVSGQSGNTLEWNLYQGPNRGAILSKLYIGSVSKSYQHFCSNWVGWPTSGINSTGEILITARAQQDLYVASAVVEWQ